MRTFTMMMMMRMEMCVIIFAGLVHFGNAAGAYGKKNGNIYAQSTVDGSLDVEEDNITIVYGIDGQSDKARNLHRADIGGTVAGKNMEKEPSVYVSDTTDIIYHQDLKRDGTAVSYGFVYEQGILHYFNGRGQVLVLPENNVGAEYSKLAPDSGINYTQPNHRPLSTKPTTTDDVDFVAVIKLLVFVDSEVVHRFQAMTDNNLTQTRDEIKKFFALTASEMTQMFQSLNQYNNVYYRGGHFPSIQDFAVEVVNVILPPTGSEFAFSKNNVDGTGRLAANALDDFGAFMSAYVSTVTYDHATFVTGYDLTLDDADLVGYSYADTLCKQSAFTSGYHTSVIEFTSAISRTWAHELGHGLGMLHDHEAGCDEQAFLMSAGSIGQLSDTAAYSKTFSACSSLSLQKYTNRISGVDFRPMCFLPTHPDVREKHLTSIQKVTGGRLTETGEQLTETGERLTDTCERLTETGGRLTETCDSDANILMTGRCKTNNLVATAFEPAHVAQQKMAQTVFTCPCTTTTCCRQVHRRTKVCCTSQCIIRPSNQGSGRDCVFGIRASSISTPTATTTTTIIPSSTITPTATATTSTLVSTTITPTSTTAQSQTSTTETPLSTTIETSISTSTISEVPTSLTQTATPTATSTMTASSITSVTSSATPTTPRPPCRCTTTVCCRENFRRTKWCPGCSGCRFTYNLVAGPDCVLSSQG